MTLNELLEMWKVDSKLTYEDVGRDSIKNSNLHSKYLEFYHKEKRKLRQLENKMLPKLRLEKREFYTMGPHEDTPEDWKLPAHGKVLYKDVETYLAGDPDIIKLTLATGEQGAIVDATGEILKTINSRRWDMKTAVDFMRITGGDI
jgi:hypothetical protein